MTWEGAKRKAHHHHDVGYGELSIPISAEIYAD